MNQDAIITGLLCILGFVVGFLLNSMNREK